MILKIEDRAEFIDNFLIPLSRINNSCILKHSDKGITTLMSAADNTVILYGKYDVALELDAPVSLNIPDVGRLTKILQCINKPSIELEINTNNVKYTSDDLRFTYHLLDDGILSQPPVSVEKIKKLEYNTSFKLPYDSLINLIKSSTFTLNINKVYISTKNGCIYAEISDKQSHNCDSICIKLSEEYTGDQITDPLPVIFDTVRILATSRTDSINVYINSKLNVMTFEVNNNKVKMTYIVSGLMK